MAVELRISVQENCDSLYVFDETGKYDKTCNKGGWCSPNTNIDDVVSAELHFYLPGTDTPIVLNVFPDLPNFDGSGYEVLPSDLGLDKFISGIWRIDFRVNTTELIYTSCHHMFTNDLSCCLEKNRVKPTPDNFDSKEVIKSNSTFALFEAAKENACLGKISETDKIVKSLYNKCNCSC